MHYPLNLFEVTPNPELNIYFERGKILAQIPSRHQALEVTPDTLTLLHFFSKEDRTDAIRELNEQFNLENLHTIVETLLNSGILIKNAAENDFPVKWQDWKRATWQFHLETRNVIYSSNEAEEAKYIEYITRFPMPEIYKCQCDHASFHLTLPAPSELKVDNLTDIFFRRRTCRNFIERAISIQTLSTTLFYTGGALLEADTKFFGRGLIKAAPSPGARHSTEIYVYIRNAEALEPGVYHYCVKHHALNFISAVEKDFIEKGIFNQTYFANAPVIFFFTSVVDRMMWKYKTSKAYRQVHFEIGHYCQNLLLAGTALGLGVFQTGAVYDSYIESYLQIDGCKEFLMYCAGIGYEDPLSQDIESSVILHPFFEGDRVKKPKKYQRF